MHKGGGLSCIMAFLTIIGAAVPGMAGQGVHGKARTSPMPLGNVLLPGAMLGFSGAALDIDNDGSNELVIGAPYAQSGKSTGAIVIYHKPGNKFRPQATVLEGDGNLGWSLVALGDVTGSGKQWFAAGAHSGSGLRASLCGTVSVYQGGRNPIRKLLLEGENAMDKFGYAMAAGDLNHDGNIDLVVGAPLHSPSPSLYQQGAVYVYFGPKFNPEQALYIPATAAYGGIGFAVATGDVNADGVPDLLLGASGKVIVFYGGQAFSPTDPDVVFTSKDAGFGRSMAVLGDIDRDGYNDVALGAYQAAVGNADSGRLFVVKGGSGKRAVDFDAVPLHFDILARIDGDPVCSQFAAAVLPIGDVDKDGVPDVAVSAVHADGDPWPMTGSIYLFSGAALARGARLQDGQIIQGQSKDMHFGAFLGLLEEGKWLVAGAPTEKENAGRIYLIDLHQGGAQ